MIGPDYHAAVAHIAAMALGAAALVILRLVGAVALASAWLCSLLERWRLWGAAR